MTSSYLDRPVRTKPEVVEDLRDLSEMYGDSKISKLADRVEAGVARLDEDFPKVPDLPKVLGPKSVVALSVTCAFMGGANVILSLAVQWPAYCLTALSAAVFSGLAVLLALHVDDVDAP